MAKCSSSIAMFRSDRTAFSCPCSISGRSVDDAPAPVSTLLPEIEVLVSGGISVGIEGHAEAEQLSDEPGSGLGHKPDDIRMRYATTGPDRILVVEPGTIIGLDRRGDAALSVVRVRLSILFLGDEQNRSLPARAVREP